MDRLVEDLLDAARLDSGTAQFKREKVRLANLLEAVAERFSLAADEKGVELRLDVDELPDINGDEDRLNQVFGNLVENALKHTPKGGVVAIGAESGRAFVEISVSDSGVGIPEEDLPRIFERFYQVDKSRSEGQGTGLGLSITRQIVEAHGGRIRAESVEGKGSRFLVRLPKS